MDINLALGAFIFYNTALMDWALRPSADWMFHQNASSRLMNDFKRKQAMVTLQGMAVQMNIINNILLYCVIYNSAYYTA